MPQIDVQDLKTLEIISIEYKDGDTIKELKTSLESMGYKPGMRLYSGEYMSMDITDISSLNQSDTPLRVLGEKSLPMVLEPEPEREPEPEPETVPTTQDEFTKLSSKIKTLSDKLKHKEATRNYLEGEGKDVDDVNLEIGLIQSEIIQLQKQASDMFKGGGKRRRRGRRKPTKSRKTKRTRKRQSLKRQSLKKRSRKRRSLKKRSLKRRSLKRRSRK